MIDPMTRRALLASSGLLLGRHSLLAQTIALRPNAGSEIALEVRKTGIMAGKKHHFTFSRYEGSVSQSPTPQVTLTIQSASLVCHDDWVKPKDVDKITRYAIDDLLEAEKYPALRFQSTAVQSTTDGYNVAGNLTIKDQTRPVTVKVIRKGAEGSPQWTGNATLKLTDFGLKPPKAALGAVGTEDAMLFSFHLTP